MLERERIVYRVGNKNNPGDPWGRTTLTIELDGTARLDQDALGGLFSWTGRVVSGALDRFWSALEEAGFPEFPMLMPPAGSAMRHLTLGATPGKGQVFLPYHADVRGYSAAFFLLDSIIRQLSGDRLKVVPEIAEELVVDAAEIPALESAPLTPKTAFLLAYLPAHRVELVAWRARLERDFPGASAELEHALRFARRALSIEDSNVADREARHRDLAKKAGILVPEVSATTGAWLRAFHESARAHLTTPLLQSAWQAGEAAFAVKVAMSMAAHLAYLRCAAPDDPDLRSQAEDRARYLQESALSLAGCLTATGVPKVVQLAHSVPKMISLTKDLTPTTSGGYKQLNELARDLDNFIEAHARELDGPSAPATPV